MKIFIFLLILIFGIFFSNTDAYALPAFPGAEGMGANSVGGRGGVVYIVDTLSDDPDDGITFREAVEAVEPRIITFAISGIIDLETPLKITKPYITLAGETSPGGVLITGWPVMIMTHDVIMSHLRFRNGCQKCFAAGNCEDTGDTLSIYSSPKPYGETKPLDAYNIIIDHCSISWGCDETFDIAAWDALTEKITVSNCIIAEGVNDAHPEANHARGLFMWGRRTLDGEAIKVSFYQNLVMSFYSRLPLANYSVSFDFVNNVVYNFENVITPTVEPIPGYTIEANMIHNYVKPGPLSSDAYPSYVGREIFLNDYEHDVGTEYELLYSIGNIGYTRTSQIGDDWTVMQYGGDLANQAWQKLAPFTFLDGIPITINTMDESYADSIVNNAGATKPIRDSVDIRLVSEYISGDLGSYINMAEIIFPVFSTTTPLVDIDSDGMSDAWEVENGFNIEINDSAEDGNGDGYTNIEEYLHYLAGLEDAIVAQIIRADVDQDSEINTIDALLTLRNSLGLDMNLTSWQDSTTTGDANCDGSSNAIDAMLLLRYSLGLDMSGSEWCE